MQARDARLFWVDLEMTGLDPSTSAIIEIASVITEPDLTVVAEGPALVVRPPAEALAGMSDFVRGMHQKNGLLGRLEGATTTAAEAERATLAFLEQHCTKGTALLCGNSVWKDRSFLEREMPAILGYLHYRIIDVSTVKELVRRWAPSSAAPKKQETHRALDDIRESIAELGWYRSKLFH